MGITGGVGAGKSAVSKILESEGWALIDSDRIVAELWRTEAVKETAVRRWGTGVLENGAVVHSRVAALIFSDRAEYGWTMSLLHPLVKKETRFRAETFQKQGRPVAAEVPMLFEAGAGPWITCKVFVAASRGVRLKRCLARGWDEAELSRRESYFMPDGERMALSDFVIWNDGGLDELRGAVESIIKNIEKYRLSARGV